MKIFVEFINKWCSGRNIYSSDVGVGNIVEVFNQRTQAVSMRNNQDRLSASHQWSNLIVPAREETRYAQQSGPIVRFAPMEQSHRASKGGNALPYPSGIL